MRERKRLLLSLFFLLWMGLSVLGTRAYYHKPEVPLDMNLQYYSEWDCIQGRCGILIITPDGPMAYEVPQPIREKIFRLKMKSENMYIL